MTARYLKSLLFGGHFTDFDCCVFDFEDVNECETGNNTCTPAQVCFNFQGSYTCLDPLQCPHPYIEVSDKWVAPPPFLKNICPY